MDDNTDKINKKVLEIIKSKRKQLKITQAELAEQLGIEQATYSSLESGKTELSFARYIQIAHILDLELPMIENHPQVIDKQAIEQMIISVFQNFKTELKKEFVSKELLKKLLDNENFE